MSSPDIVLFTSVALGMLKDELAKQSINHRGDHFEVLVVYEQHV